MSLSEKEIKQVVDFVKKEPRTVQDISRLIKRSWVTTDSYLKKIADDTGLLSIKTFRKGSQGALKIVYYNHSESLMGDSLKENIYGMIRNGRNKADFDFMEIFQYVDEKKKKHLITEIEAGEISENERLVDYFRQVKSRIICFSGNLSFINIRRNKMRMIDLIEETVKRGVVLKILCRINLASLSNIAMLQSLIEKYPGSIEIRHCYQPLRGFIFDDKIARFKNEEQVRLYKRGELERNTVIFYEVYDAEWISWLENVFWNLFRTSIDYDSRLREIKRISG
jgi:predicted transcriptional regulator